VIAARPLEAATVQQPGKTSAARGKFAGPPVIAKGAGGWEVAFSLTAPNDVTVRILDANGNGVRHVACGMVGLEKAARPFVPKSLDQKLLWDGKDDAGKPVDAAGCKAWVGVGVRAKFDKFILWEKDACPRSRANNYYTAANGDCYVNQSAGVHLDTLRLFNSNGKLVRQVWPPSLERPREALEKLLAGSWGATDWDGDGVPRKVCYNSWYIFGVRSGGMARTSDGCLVSIFTGVGRGAYVLDANDFPAAMHWYPPWYDRQQMYKTKPRLAAGTDGDFYLTDDFHHIVGHFRAKDMALVGSFTHRGNQKLAEPSFILGEKGKTDSDGGLFHGPEDIAVDADGNLCVLDGDKVKVYARDGKFLREDGKDAFPRAPAVPRAVASAEKAPRALCFPQFLKIRADGKLIVMNHHNETPILQTDFDGKECKALTLPWSCRPYHGYSAFDAEGNWYAVISASRKPQAVWKYASDGKRAKFGDKDEIVIEHEGDAFSLSKGICVAANGDIHVVVQTDKWKQKAPEGTGGVKFGDLSARGAAACQTRVDVYGPDGTCKNKGLVRSVGINDVALDREGNIYVIEGTMWHGAQMGGVASGEWLYGKRHWPFSYLTPQQAALDPKSQANKRYSLLSRLVKFSPAGGVLDDPGDKAQLWHYAGVSGVSPWNCDAECPAAQICVDPDERVWVPDSFLYCVKAIDKAGNEMVRVGKYGNEDCRGGGGDRRHSQVASVVVDPEVPLAYPKGMAVYKDWLFISDMFSHRVLRCGLQYAETKEALLMK
jgi:hypothetical protein